MAIHTRHVHVADDQTKGLLLQSDECGFAAVDGSMCIAAQFERDTQCFAGMGHLRPAVLSQPSAHTTF